MIIDYFFFTVPEIATPPLLGNILPGVTRDSLIALAKEWVMTLFVKHTFVALNDFEQSVTIWLVCTRSKLDLVPRSIYWSSWIPHFIGFL